MSKGLKASPSPQFKRPPVKTETRFSGRKVNVPLVDLDPDGCRFITAGDKLEARFCNLKAYGGSSWCVMHFRETTIGGRR